MTIRDLIRRSLVLIGVLGEGESPSAEMQADAFLSLKEMLESWSIDSLNIPTQIREEFALVANQASYTFGLTGNFNSARPTRIRRAAVIDNGSEIPIEIINLDQWADISVKSQTSTLPTDLYLEGSSPFATVNLYPIPSEVKTLVLYSDKPLLSTVTVDSVLTFPPGYTRAIRYNLAIELADEYSKVTPGSVPVIAARSLASIKRQNSKPIYLTPDLTSGSQSNYNIHTGE